MIGKIGTECIGGLESRPSRQTNTSTVSPKNKQDWSVSLRDRPRSRIRWLGNCFDFGRLEHVLKRHTTQSERPLRVAHLIQYFAIGGLERMVERLSVACLHRGVESVVIAYLGDGPIREALRRHGIQTILLESGPGLDPGLALQIRKILVRERVDVLHTHHLGPFIYGAPAAVSSRRRHVHTEHSHELYDRRRRHLGGALMSVLSDVVAVTPEIAEYRKRFPGTCRVIRNGVPIPPPTAPTERVDARMRLGLPTNAFVVGCAARLSEEKNHEGLIRAFAEFRRREPRAFLACAGDGPLRDRLREVGEQAGVDSSVAWLGALDDMGAFYRAVDVCALNSHREGLPLSLLEAMSYGLPVVASAVGGVGELLGGGEGLLVPPSDSTAVADALTDLASSPAEAKRLGLLGRQLVQDHYSIEKMADEYVTLYRKLAKKPFPPGAAESVSCA